MSLELNHIALFVKDVENSSKFYEEVIGLHKIPRPAFDFPGAWFGIGEFQQLHLIGIRTTQDIVEHSNPRGNHFALRVKSYKQTEEMLISKKIVHQPPRKRPDGAMQIFLQDPDGYYIELVEIFE
jgi:lactoylglutathione lyase